MKKLIGVSAVAISLFASNVVDFGIGGGRNGVTNSAMKHYNFVNIRIGKKLSSGEWLRFELERSTAVKIYGLKHYLNRVMVNFEKDFSVGETLSPYVFIGGGYQWPKGPYDNAPLADAGIGVKISLTRNFGLFAEARGIRDFNNYSNHLGFLGGVEFSFGSCEESEPQPQFQPKPVKLEKPKPKTKPKPVIIDTDHDGVPDSMDKCPNTPAGVKVDKFGCPVDSDADGVPDYLDKCPNTPKGIHVDKNGCPVSFNFDITFDCCSAKIKPQYMKKIEEFAEFLKQNPAYKAEIEGYTDSTGSRTYNIILSQKRAKAVYEELIKLGISKDRLKWVGFGPANPVAPNDTPEGRAKNRRVVAKLYF
jgi:OOP family OmpA-OmpF porin